MMKTGDLEGAKREWKILEAIGHNPKPNPHLETNIVGQKETVNWCDIRCSWLLSVAMKNIMTESILGEGRVYLAYSSRSHSLSLGDILLGAQAGTWYRNLRRKLLANSLAGSWHCLSYSTQDLLPGDAATHCGLGFPTAMTNPDNPAHRTAHVPVQSGLLSSGNFRQQCQDEVKAKGMCYLGRV